ncbi:MAG TPA: hypothetical protein VH541_05615 [Gaiellaceae bacterium]|jgi:hypothetical protein
MALDMIAGAAAPGMTGAGGPDPGYGAGPGGPGPGVDPGQQQAPSGGDPNSMAADILGQMLDLATQYMQIEPDEEDKQIVATCIAQLQKVRAKDQQDADKLTQGTVTPRALRAALGG